MGPSVPPFVHRPPSAPGRRGRAAYVGSGETRCLPAFSALLLSKLTMSRKRTRKGVCNIPHGLRNSLYGIPGLFKMFSRPIECPPKPSNLLFKTHQSILQCPSTKTPIPKAARHHPNSPPQKPSSPASTPPSTSTPSPHPPPP